MIHMGTTFLYLVILVGGRGTPQIESVHSLHEAVHRTHSKKETTDHSFTAHGPISI